MVENHFVRYKVCKTSKQNRTPAGVILIHIPTARQPPLTTLYKTNVKPLTVPRGTLVAPLVTPTGLCRCVRGAYTMVPLSSVNSKHSSQQQHICLIVIINSIRQSAKHPRVTILQVEKLQMGLCRTSSVSCRSLNRSSSSHLFSLSDSCFQPFQHFHVFLGGFLYDGNKCVGFSFVSVCVTFLFMFFQFP